MTSRSHLLFDIYKSFFISSFWTHQFRYTSENERGDQSVKTSLKCQDILRLTGVVLSDHCWPRPWTQKYKHKTSECDLKNKGVGTTNHSLILPQYEPRLLHYRLRQRPLRSHRVISSVHVAIVMVCTPSRDVTGTN